MLGLRTASPSLSVAEAERVARDLYGLAVSVGVLPGERDCNFLLRTGDGASAAVGGAAPREFVLKVQDLRTDPEGPDCLVRVLDHVAQQDPVLPVPRPYPTLQGQEVGRIAVDGIDCATCLLSFLRGRRLLEVAPSAALLQSVGGALARVDHALQGFFHPSLNRPLAWDVRRLPELAEFSGCLEPPALRDAVAKVAGAFRSRLKKIRGLRSQAIHGDCHPANLLVDSGSRTVCGILDFGDMIHAPLMFEAAVAMSELLTEASVPLAAVAELLHGYTQAHPLSAGEVDLLYDVIVARHAVTLLVHAWRRRHDPRGARALDEPAANSARSLDELLKAGVQALTEQWHRAAGTAMPTEAPAPPVDLARRHRLLGKGAELFYERPLHLVRGRGVWLYDARGQAYLDAYNNVPHVGHTHPAVVAAIQKQTALLATHTRYLHENVLEYAEQLTTRLPASLNACIFVNSGSEANDVAWRMATMATGGHGALVMEHAYHGVTDAVAALTPGAGHPVDPWVVTIAPPPPTPWTGSLGAAVLPTVERDADRAIADLAARGFAPAAFFIDTALTSSGIFDPPPLWAAAVSGRVRAAGGFIVADEVQYGLGRCGSHFWGFERRGMAPDIVTLGKPVGNGYPMGVVVADRALVEAFQARFGFFSTFGGNAVAAAAGLAVLKVLDEEGLAANAADTGDYLRVQLEEVALRHDCLGEVRGNGLLLGLEVRSGDGSLSTARTRRILNAMAAQHGILIGYEGPAAAILKLRPPLPFGRGHADLLIAALDAAATSVESSGP